MSAAHRIGVVDEAPARINAGALTRIETLFVTNSHATDTVYIHVYALAGEVAPSGTASLRFTAGCRPGVTPLPLDIEMSHLWIAASAAEATLSAPAADPTVSYTG